MENYNKLLEKARKTYSECVTGAEKRRLESLFPELKESEDERIRKAIHIYLDWLDGRKDYAPKGEYSIRDMIAWLEKQGQSKRTSIWKHWKDGIAGNGDGIPAFLIKNGLTYSLSSCLGFECDYIELSELDRPMLEKQGEQKFVWSDEDEGKLFLTISLLNYFKEEAYTNDCENCINWLKSLKPQSHWKPTEEQIRALSMAYKDSLTSGENLITQTETLKSLYNDLKKL